ncbi:MAG: phospholipase D family protein [Myxococcales bacterium]|nr:phospholipase D family protein [Myxococcales bacterium]
MGLDRTDSLAVLEALAPDPGWATDVAIVSSYSVDLVAAAALVVALAGEGEDHERMRNAPLARACERMRDRFRVVCQAGRIVVPSAGTSVLVVADRWIREVPHDGNDRSWHAKLALVRYSPIDEGRDESEWRLWIGSRNLTRDTSWDSALTAVGRVAGTSDDIDRAVSRAGEVLAGRADLPDWGAGRVGAELRQVHWEWPAEVQKVMGFALWPDAAAAPGFPSAPSGLQRVVAVSPFMDGATTARLSRWGRGATRQLLTTPPTLATLAAQKSAPLAGFTSLHQLDSPAAPEDGDADQDETGDDQMVEVHRGLHAKLIWARGPKGDELWLGSANLTQRAWDGRNTEAVVHARVASTVGNGLVDGLIEGLAVEVDPDDLIGGGQVADPAEAAFDALRNRIAASWDARLTRNPRSGAYECETSAALLASSDDATLTVRLLGQPAGVAWPRGATRVTLPATAPHRQTELVVLELRSTATQDLAASWLARATLDPPPDVARDRAVLARLMGPRAFLAWLRALLDEVAGEGGDEAWPEDPRRRASARDAGWSGGSGVLYAAPTLESVLRAWVRNPSAVQQVDRALETWGRELRAALPEDAGEEERQALGELERFESTWAVVRQGLDLARGEAP